MRDFLVNLFDTSRYTSLTDRERARTIYGIAIVMAVGAIIYLLTSYSSTSGKSFLELALTTSSSLRLYVVVFYVLCVISILLTRSGRINFGAGAIVMMWFLGIGIGTALGGLYNMTGGMVLLMQVLLAGLLLSYRGMILGTGLAAILLLVGLNARASAVPPTNYSTPNELFPVVIISAVLIGIVYLYLRFTRLNREQGLNESLEDRLRLAEITTQITQRISGRVNLDEVLDTAVNFIIQSYSDIYHAQIFLVDDDGQKARLVSSTGEAGRVLLQRQHNLDVGSNSVIGQVTSSAKPVVARARAMNTIHRRNELLPDTRVEAAFPLMIGDKVIGALDLQSKEAIAFEDRDLPIFQTLADHIAVSIDNARLFGQLEQRLSENRQLAEQSRNALREVERLNMRLTGRAWSEFLRNNQGADGISVDFSQNAVQEKAEWTPGLQEAVQHNDIIEQMQQGQRVIAAPLRVRGQVIGAMEFELDENGDISPEDLELVQEVSERFGLAVENARLFEQSQRVAQREALINEIGSRLQQSNNVEATLSQAAQSLKQALKANRVSIRLGAPPSENGGEKENGA
jgi:GAF domain-containing protein